MTETFSMDSIFARLDRINDAMIKWSIPATMESSAVFVLLAAQSWSIMSADRGRFLDLVASSNVTLRDLRSKGARAFDHVPRDSYQAVIDALRGLASENRMLRMRVITALQAAGIRFDPTMPPCLLATALTLQARAGLPEEIVTGAAKAIYDLAEAELHELERLHASRN